MVRPNAGREDHSDTPGPILSAPRGPGGLQLHAVPRHTQARICVENLELHLPTRRGHGQGGAAVQVGAGARPAGKHGRGEAKLLQRRIEQALAAAEVAAAAAVVPAIQEDSKLGAAAATCRAC